MKIKKLGALLVSAALCAGMAAPAFAFEGEAAPVEQPVLPEVVEEDVVTVTDETSGALTPEGNLTLVDDYHTSYSDGSGQQFITLVSKSGATFYLVIDRNIYKSYGAALYREMLSILVDAWDGDSDSFLSGILHGMARFLALYQGEYSRDRLILRLHTVHPKTITRLAQNDTGNVADRHMKQILSIYNGAGRAHSLPCKR